MIPGGQIATTSTVENFPGFPDGIEGPDLSEAMLAHAKKWGAKTTFSEVTGIRVDGDYRVVETSDGEVAARALIITSGADHRRLGVPGEMEYMGKGVSNCAVCDGASTVACARTHASRTSSTSCVPGSQCLTTISTVRSASISPVGNRADGSNLVTISRRRSTCSPVNCSLSDTWTPVSQPSDA